MPVVHRLSGLWNRVPTGRDLDEAFGRFFDEAGRRLGVGAYPAVNVWEETEAYHVEAEVPGLREEEIQVVVSQRTQVSLLGEQKSVARECVWHRRELPVGKFERVLTFPEAIDPDKVVAKLENGILHLTLPKAEENKPRRIEVKVG
jgi:HSP20 family protein